MEKEEIEVAGRKVLVATSYKSQSVNVYGTAHTPGEYEHIVLIDDRTQFVRPRDLERQDFEAIGAMLTYLQTEHGGQLKPGRKAPYLRR